MKPFDRVIGIGCSFTHGGGLEVPSVYEHYTKNTWNELDAELFKYKNNYIGQLAKKLNIPFENLSDGGISNEVILEKAYERFNKNKKVSDDSQNVLLIIQTSFFHRIRMFKIDEEFKKLISHNLLIPYDDKSIVNCSPEILYEPRKTEFINNRSKEYSHILDIYENILKYSYNEHLEQKKLLQQINVHIMWLRSKNVTTIILPYQFYGTDTSEVLLIDNMDLGELMDKNNLLIRDIPECGHNDMHFSLEGHAFIANKLYNYIQTL